MGISNEVVAMWDGCVMSKEGVVLLGLTREEGGGRREEWHEDEERTKEKRNKTVKKKKQKDKTGKKEWKNK